MREGTEKMPNFIDINRETVEEPKGYVKTRTYELDGGALESPIFVGHKRGHNWALASTVKTRSIPSEFIFGSETAFSTSRRSKPETPS